MKTYKQIKTIGMKKLQLLCLLMLAFFTFSCYDDSDILNRLDAMESDRVASIETQMAAAQSSIEALQAADVALDKYIDALEVKSDSLAQVLQNSDQQLDNRIDEVYEMTMKELALVNAELQALNSQDSLLNVRLTELNDYIAQVEAQQKAEHDWVQQTFSTLEQYEATCAAIAGLEAHLQTVDGELLDLTKALAEQKQALEQSIADAVTSVKSWVNEQLSGYYTIAQTDAKIAAVLDTMTQENAELRQQLTQMQDSLAQTRIDLTTSYQSAIKQAIEEYDGKITKEIAAQVESLNKRIDDEVAAINAQLQALADRVAALEKEMEELKKALDIKFDQANPNYQPGEVVNVAFTLSNADENTVVEAIAEGLWKARVSMDGYDKGTIKVTTSAGGGEGKVLVFVNKGNATIMRVLLFDQGVVRVLNDAITVSPSDTTLVVNLSTSVPEIKVVIPDDAQSWIRQCELPVTKADMREESIAFAIDLNLSKEPRETIIRILSSETNKEKAAFSIYQQSDVMGNNEIWYTSTDGQIVEPSDPGAFRANIISNTYLNGKGVLRFDADVDRLGESTFTSCYTLKTITLPESVKTIGKYAFQWCNSLTEIYLPQTLTEIPEETFWGCSSLTKINLPETLLSINGYAFASCSSLAQIDLPKSLSSIGCAAFDYCSSLTEIVLPESLSRLDGCAFRNCTSLTKISLPVGLTTIAGSVFSECSNLEEVVMENVISIEDNAFYKCRKLKKVSIRGGFIPSTASATFTECYLEDIALQVPAGYKAIYEQAELWKDFGSIEENEVVINIGTLSNMLSPNYDSRHKELNAGSILSQASYVSMKVGGDDMYTFKKSSTDAVAKVGTHYMSLKVQVAGNTNPKDADNENCDKNVTVPANGAFFTFDVEKDGYLYVFFGGNSHKTYLVGEDDALIGYEFAMTTPAEQETPWGTLLSYIMKGEGENNRISSPEGLIWPEKIALGDAWEAAAGSGGKIAASGQAVVKFPVSAGHTYSFCGCGTKVSCAGFIFFETEEDVYCTENGVTTLMMAK